MATKDFNKLTTKKLQALMETASEEDKVKIQEVLDARAQKSADKVTKTATSTMVEMAPESELSPEEEAAIAQAEKDLADKQAGKEVKTKKMMTPEEIEAIKSKCEENIGHRCEVLPYGEVEWRKAIIIGVMHDKRSNAIMYRIKEEETGKVSHKAYDAKILRILDETVEITRSARGTSANGSSNKQPKKTDEEALKLKEDARQNIAKIVTIKVGEETKQGTIVGVMHDKRSNAVMYRINVEDKTIYKVVDSDLITITEMIDEELLARHNKALAAAEAREKALAEMTPEKRVQQAEADVKKAEEALKNAAEKLEWAKKRLADAQEAYAKETEASQEAATEEVAAAEAEKTEETSEEDLTA